MDKSVMLLPPDKTVDVYFYNAGRVAEALPYDARVRYRYFARQPGMFFGTQFIRRMIDETCNGYWEKSRPVVKALPEGTPFEGKQLVMEIEWEFRKLVGFETAILGVLSHCGTAREMSEIVRAAKGRPVYAFEARHFPPEMAALTACAAKLGGASGTSSTTGAATAIHYYFGGGNADSRYCEGPAIFAKEPVGTTPHACSAVMPTGADDSFYLIDGVQVPFEAPVCLPEVRCAEIFARTHPDKPCLVLNDYSGRELDASREAVNVLSKYPNFWGVRCDTCGERFHQEAALPASYVRAGMSERETKTACREWENAVGPERLWRSGRGVTVELARNVRKAMDEVCGQKAKIMLSSGFGVEKTRFFDEQGAPFDAVGTGSFVKLLTLTSDIVAVRFREDGTWERRVKAGREWLADLPLDGLEEWIW